MTHVQSQSVRQRLPTTNDDRFEATSDRAPVYSGRASAANGSGGQDHDPAVPRTRSAALQLGRSQFKRIDAELNRLLGHVKAGFVGLIDTDGNMIGAAGTLDDYDLQVLTRALSIDHSAQKSLADLLDEHKFHSTYFEGEKNDVYIIEFGSEIVVSLAVISGRHVKPGMVWLYTKRTAAIIDDILKTVPKPKSLPRLQ